MRGKRSKKTGMPPGALVYLGDKPSSDSIIQSYRFNGDSYDERQTKSVAEALAPPREGEVLWLDVNGIHNIQVLESIGSAFGIHPLVLEDILNTAKRPKVEDFEQYLFVVLKVIHPNAHGHDFRSEQVSIILGKNFVISFQELEQHDAFMPVRERLKSNRGRIRKMGADYLAYALMDSVVDSYFGVLEVFGEHLEALERTAIESAAPDTLRRIHRTKQQTLQLRRAVWPVREIMSSILREESDLISKPVLVYLRDVYDHTVEVIDVLEGGRELAASLMEMYLSSLSNRLNSVMMVLTVITTIFMPLSFIAGVYGMNFKFMPELESPLGYPAVLLTMALIAIGMLAYFRSRKWI